MHSAPHPETKGYGYGLWVRFEEYDQTITKVSQRFGRILGVKTLISRYLEKDITIIILGNTNKVNVFSIQEIVGETFLL